MNLLNIGYSDFEDLKSISEKSLIKDINITSSQVLQCRMSYRYYDNPKKYLSELVSYSLQCNSKFPFVMIFCKMQCISDCILISYTSDTTNPKVTVFDQKSRIENAHVNEFIKLKKSFDVTQAMNFLDFIESSAKIQSRITLKDCLYIYTTTYQKIDPKYIYRTEKNEKIFLLKNLLNPQIVLLTRESMQSFFWNCMEYLSFF